jgi:hypothetical protein
MTPQLWSVIYFGLVVLIIVIALLVLHDRGVI